MTRYDLKIGITLLAIVVMLGLVIGFVVGSLGATKRAELSAPGAEAPTFDGAAREDGGPPSVVGIPDWADLYVNDYQDLLSDDAERR